MFEPNATIVLYKGVPLDNTYRNTFYFNTPLEQAHHFDRSRTSYDFVEFNNQTYQRVNKGKLRIKATADQLYGYNYMLFRNNINGEASKIIFCFITSVEYYSQNMTEVTYEVDVMQTWFFDYNLGMCFVEREHSVNDVIGENLVPEDLEIGDYNMTEPTYINTKYDSDNNVTQWGLDKYVIAVASSIKSDETGAIVNSEGATYNGLFSGLTITFFENNSSGVTRFNNFIKKVVDANKSDGIVSVFLLPTAIAIKGLGYTNQKETYTINKNYSTIKHTDGSAVRNNKLYTYPYNFLYVTNMQGVSAEFPYEYFSSSVCRFFWYGDCSPNPSVVLVPSQYKGLQTENFDEKIMLTGFPQLSFNVDTYRAWVAQNRGTLAVDALSNVANYGKSIARTSISLASGNYIGAFSSAIEGGSSYYNNIANTLGKIYDKSTLPPQSKGGGSPLLLASFGKLNYLFTTKYIRPEYVDIIDGFFDMYGYATHKVKVPNCNSRPYWNYVKTNGCILLGTTGCPADVTKAICSIYDNGITFWHKVNNNFYVGDYSKDNRVVS